MEKFAGHSPLLLLHIITAALLVLSREILSPEPALKSGLLRVNSCKFRLLMFIFGSELFFSGFFFGKSISQVLCLLRMFHASRLRLS